MVDYVVWFSKGVQISGILWFLGDFLPRKKNRPSPGQEAAARRLGVRTTAAKVVIDRDQKDFHGILPGTIANWHYRRLSHLSIAISTLRAETLLEARAEEVAKQVLR